MQLRYNFRVYPTPGQREALARAFGCARVVFNDALHARRAAHVNGDPYPSDGELSKQVITRAKYTPERAWLGEVSAVVLQQALADLNTAYRNFFSSITGARKGRKVAPPRFRSRKDNRQAIRFTRNARFTVLGNGRLRLPKIGDLDVRWSRDLPSEPSSVTIVKDAAGRYFASFVVASEQDETLPSSESEVGIDLGLTHFAVLSDGTKVTAPKFLRQAARRLARLQQALSRKAKGSNRRKKAVVKVAHAHAKVADTRRDWQHKLSTAIIRDNQAVYVEDLCVAGLGRTRLANSFLNYDAILMDCATITIGNDVSIGPRAQLLTALHPIEDHEARRQRFETAAPITIGDNVWLGGGVIVCAGVTIGDNAVIGAGSVVTRDIPPRVLAVGNPCKVIREL